MNGKLILLCAATAAVLSLRAEWVTQEIQLVKGYNGVHLKVNPADTRCNVVFADDAIERVTWYNRDSRDDGSGIVPQTMHTWYRTNEVASTFHRVLGGHAYIVYATANVTLSVKGTPSRTTPKIHLGGSANLIGMWTPLEGDAYYGDYFQGFVDKLASNPYNVVSPLDGTALSDGVDKMSKPQAAIWLDTKGDGTVEWDGPISVELSTPGEIVNWAEDTEARRLTIRNNTDVPRTVTIDLAASETPPPGQGTLLGPATLLVEDIDWRAGYPRRVYKTCTFPLVTNLAANASVKVGFRPDLQQMPPGDGYYAGVLGVTDGAALHRIGVKAEGSLTATRVPTGLWIGTVSLSGVNRERPMSSLNFTNDFDSVTPQPTTQTFDFRLLVHVDADGTARLLKEVFVASEAGDNDEPVLLTARNEAINYRNEHPNAKIRRLSSANFPFFGEPQAMTGGAFATAGGELTCTFSQGYDDKVNPFVHQFHPQHDNKVFKNKIMHDKTPDEYEPTLGVGDYESWAIQRQVTMTFAGEDPIGSNYDWNGSVTGGDYKEVVRSLNETEIITTGGFRLTKVASTPHLTFVFKKGD